jgi:hypothetical protein
VYANSGTQVALFGAGGGSGTTLYGGLNGTTGNFSGDLVVNGATIGRRTARNIVFGAGALNSSTTGVANTAIGDTALFANTSGNSSTAVGAFSLANNTASSNDAFGAQSLLFNTTGTLNAGLGNRALLYNTTGSRNIGIGSDAGSIAGNNPSASSNTTPSKSIYIGFATRPLANAQTNQIVIGDSAIGNGSNTVTIGNSSVTDNYFSGTIRGTQLRVTDSIVGGGTRLTGGLSGTTLGMTGDAQFNTNVSVLSNLSRGTTSTIANSQIYSYNFGESGLRLHGVATTDGNPFGTINFGNTNDISGGYLSARIRAVRRTFDNGADIEFATAVAASTPTTRMVISSGGSITALGVYDATVGGTNRDVFVDNTGLIGYVSSFRASKKNIAPLSKTDWLHKLNPVTFNYRVKDSTGKYTDSAYKEKEYGLVAEEVETVNPEMVFYDVDSSGKHLRGVHYSKLIIPLLKEIQDQKKRIDAQQTAIEALIKRIELLEKR